MKRILFACAAFGAIPFISINEVQAQAAPNPNELRICSGTTSGNYAMATKEITDRLGGLFTSIKIINTDGSLDNLRRLSRGECDMGFTQSDVADLYRIENPASMNVLYPFKTIYSEYGQMLCPAATGWSKLSDLGEARKKGTPVKMIVGGDGSGPSETWRTIWQANPDAYKGIERIPQKVDIEAASRVKDSKDTCMFWVSGLNSSDMQSANDMSIRTKDRKPALTLISVDDPVIKEIKDGTGQPVYTFEKVTAKAPEKDKTSGVYNNLIPDRSGWFSSADHSVTVPTVNAILMTTNAYRTAIKDKTARMVTQIEDAQVTIWNKVNPGQGQ